MEKPEKKPLVVCSHYAKTYMSYELGYNRGVDDWSAWILHSLENIKNCKHDKETEIYLLIQRIKEKG